VNGPSFILGGGVGVCARNALSVHVCNGGVFTVRFLTVLEGLFALRVAPQQHIPIRWKLIVTHSLQNILYEIFVVIIRRLGYVFGKHGILPTWSE